MNNFWFGDSDITEQEVIIVVRAGDGDGDGDEFGVSLTIKEN